MTLFDIKNSRPRRHPSDVSTKKHRTTPRDDDLMVCDAHADPLATITGMTAAPARNIARQGGRNGVRVAIIANEFFDANINRVGGFGWAASRAASALQSDPAFDRPVYLSGERFARSELEVGGVRTLTHRESWLKDVVRAWREQIDVMLCIDYRPSYRHWFKALPRTPVIVWVRDPRTPEAKDRIRTLRLPDSAARPGGVADWDCQSLGRFKEKTKWLGRKIMLANKMAYMQPMIPSVYGVPESNLMLPNPDIINYAQPLAAKSPRPRVVSLGRLDPIKRPWLFVELARHFPEVEFIALGHNFIQGSGNWQPRDAPANLSFMGNLTGPDKLELLSSAWCLVNTSIHEESAVSMLEALACETPIISFIESDGLSKRFGICLGYDTGTGLGSMPALVLALRQILENHELRSSLASSGRRWVMREHNTSAFLGAFKSICSICDANVSAQT